MAIVGQFAWVISVDDRCPADEISGWLQDRKQQMPRQMSGRGL
jgi:hypothetical protein